LHRNPFEQPVSFLWRRDAFIDLIQDQLARERNLSLLVDKFALLLNFAGVARS